MTLEENSMPYPELVEPDEFKDREPYRIEGCPRYSPSGQTDIGNRRMIIPLTPIGKMIARHEMAHVKWSPEKIPRVRYHQDIIQSVEDARINMGLANKGIPMGLETSLDKLVSERFDVDLEHKAFHACVLRTIASIGTSCEHRLKRKVRDLPEPWGRNGSEWITRIENALVSGAKRKRLPVAPFALVRKLSLELAKDMELLAQDKKEEDRREREEEGREEEDDTGLIKEPGGKPSELEGYSDGTSTDDGPEEDGEGEVGGCSEAAPHEKPAGKAGGAASEPESPEILSEPEPKPITVKEPSLHARRAMIRIQKEARRKNIKFDPLTRRSGTMGMLKGIDLDEIEEAVGYQPNKRGFDSYFDKKEFGSGLGEHARRHYSDRAERQRLKRKDGLDAMGLSGRMDIHRPPLNTPQEMVSAGNAPKPKCSTEGSVIIRPDRLCIDRAIFGRRGSGGVGVGFSGACTILIDISGSMGLSTTDIENLVSAAGGYATVATYCGSGKSGRLTIVASAAKRASRDDMRRTGPGNIVDLPALKWLATQSHPRIWVCDGAVTGVGDHYHAAINLACDEEAVRGRITRFPDVDDAIKNIKNMDRTALKFGGDSK